MILSFYNKLIYLILNLNIYIYKKKILIIYQCINTQIFMLLNNTNNKQYKKNITFIWLIMNKKYNLQTKF